jgi:WD40 repeat protein
MNKAARLVLTSFALVFSTSGLALAQGDKKKVEPATPSYYRDVRPILVQNCQGCHQPAKAMGDSVLTSYEALFAKGSSGETGVVPGKPEQSNVLTQITAHAGKKPAMPKGRDPLTDFDVRVIQKWIAQGAKDDTPASARIVIDAEHPPVYTNLPVVTAIEYSPDGKLLAVAGYHEVLLHKADGSGLVGRLVGMSERVESLAFSPDGKLLAVTGGDPSRTGEVQVWDVASRSLKLSAPVTYDTVFGASWSPDGTKIAFGCADNTLRVIDAKTGKQVLFQGAHGDWVLDTVFSIDGSHLVSVSRDRSMKLTEVGTQRFVDNITSITPGALKGGLMTVRRHPKKDELLVGGADGTPKIYKMYREKKRVIGDDFNLIRAFPTEAGRVCCVRFSKDGEDIVAAYTFEEKGTARVYHVADGKLRSELAGQRGAVYTVAFSPDGKVVASAGFDGLVRLNNVATGKLIKEFAPAPVRAKVATGGR